VIPQKFMFSNTLDGHYSILTAGDGGLKKSTLFPVEEKCALIFS